MAGQWSGRRAAALRAATLAEYGTICHLCGRPGATTADHVIPRSKGGPDSLDNLRPAHYSCNSSRGARSLEDWRVLHTPRRAPQLAPSRKW
ncbi:HNH endonuclease [Nocardia brasiliensis]|uniref:HNH endonuclease n=1 Tax=Nocardia brasiliensis TaxID=37326 RepID=UPI0024542361|nr:HNH endonuclease signature motif containing protein [Nocardia brasiliensis]